MWLLTALLALVGTLLAHAVVVRRFAGRSGVILFLGVGAMVGGLFVVLTWLTLPTWIERAAAVALYAFACELYLFLFTFVSSSITVSLLLRLRHGSLDGPGIERAYAARGMVDDRLRKLQTNRLIEPRAGTLRLTARGRQLLLAFERLRAYFHGAPGPGGVASLDPGSRPIRT
jgi:hypothetical protein